MADYDRKNTQISYTIGCYLALSCTHLHLNNSLISGVFLNGGNGLYNEDNGTNDEDDSPEYLAINGVRFADVRHPVRAGSAAKVRQ